MAVVPIVALQRRERSLSLSVGSIAAIVEGAIIITLLITMWFVKRGRAATTSRGRW